MYKMQYVENSEVKEETLKKNTEFTGDGDTICCAMCSKRFACLMDLADHVSIVHKETCTTVASQLSTEEETHINYYDVIPIAKLEIDENGIKVERKDISFCQQSSVMGLNSTHNENIVIKSEYSPEEAIDCKEEEIAAQNVLKKLKYSDVRYTVRADQLGPGTLIKTRTAGAASLQNTVEPERGSNEYNDALKHEAPVNVSLQTRDEITEDGRLANANFYFKTKRCSKFPNSEGTEIEALVSNNRDYNQKRISSTRKGIGECSGQGRFAYDRGSNVKKHMQTHTGKKPYACDVCNYTCINKSILGRHIRTHTGEKPFACNTCNYKCSFKSSLVRHIKKHNGVKPFACNICDYKCTEKCILKRHIRKHTGDKPFACTICDYKSSEKSNLRRHIRTHTGEKPFACNMCDYKCRKKSRLQCHIRTHTGEKPFACNICDYKCSEKSNLRSHIRRHTGEKPFACNICDYKCSEKSNLRSHIRRHTGEKPFGCNICDYKCSEKSNLRSHIRTHTGEKPFACNICDYKCSEKSRLQCHIKTHTEKEPFACNICDYKSSEKSNLRVHIRTHTVEKPFACNICDYNCSVKSRL